MKHKDRTNQLIAAALVVAEREGYMTMTREQIAAEAQCSPGLVSLHLGTMPAMRRMVMRAAVRQRVLRVVAQGLAMRDPVALKADATVRGAAVAGLQ